MIPQLPLNLFYEVLSGAERGHHLHRSAVNLQEVCLHACRVVCVSLRASMCVCVCGCVCVCVCVCVYVLDGLKVCSVTELVLERPVLTRAGC